MDEKAIPRIVKEEVERGRDGIEDRRTCAQVKFCPWLSYNGLKECLRENCAFFQEHFNECALKTMSRLLATKF
jgi:hypothetical protein